MASPTDNFFRSLPPELRLQVYWAALDGKHPSVPPLWRVSKLLYSECTPVLYGKRLLFGSEGSLGRFLVQIGKAGRSLLSAVELVISAHRSYPVPCPEMGHLAECSRLSSLRVERFFRFPFSHERERLLRRMVSAIPGIGGPDVPRRLAILAIFCVSFISKYTLTCTSTLYRLLGLGVMDSYKSAWRALRTGFRRLARDLSPSPPDHDLSDDQAAKLLRLMGAADNLLEGGQTEALARGIPVIKTRPLHLDTHVNTTVLRIEWRRHNEGDATMKDQEIWQPYVRLS